MIAIIQSSSIEDGSSPPGAPDTNDISNIKVRDDDEENKRRVTRDERRTSTTLLLLLETPSSGPVVIQV